MHFAIREARLTPFVHQFLLSQCWQAAARHYYERQHNNIWRDGSTLRYGANVNKLRGAYR